MSEITGPDWSRKGEAVDKEMNTKEEIVNIEGPQVKGWEQESETEGDGIVLREGRGKKWEVSKPLTIYK